MQPTQLALFGKRKRTGRGSKEFNLHVMVAGILTRWGTPDWEWTHLPFGEHRSAITGARLKRMGTKRGWPDFILLAPPDEPIDGGHFDPRWLFGRVHFLELKRKGAKLTPEQEEVRCSILAKGHTHHTADNFDDALAILKKWGAVRASVSV